MKKSEKRFYELWKEIEDNFDFDKVFKTMKILDWFWSFENNVTAIPSIYTIKELARDKLHEVYFGEYDTIGSGGFIASYINDRLILEFIIESWEA